MKVNLLRLLMVLIAMQSTIAVADLHQFHQINPEETQYNSQQVGDVSNDVSNNDQVISNSKIQSNTSYDCQHCCHCHGFVQFYLDNFDDTVLRVIEPKIINQNPSRFSSHVISPDLRPPIV